MTAVKVRDNFLEVAARAAYGKERKGLHQVRLKDCRIVYELKATRLVIVAVKIGTRGGAYRE